MCCCNPSPFPNVSLMYINPNSRGQCVLGEVKLLSSQSIAFNLHSSACGPHSGPETCVLLFQRQAVYLELITGTHSDLSGLPIPVRLSTCFPSVCVQCICVHFYLCGRLFLFSVPLLWVAIFVMQKSETISYWPTNRSTMWQPIIPPEVSSASTVKQHIRVISLWDWIGCRWDWCRHPQSHCALPLLLPVNQSEPSVFVMVEDNQFQNKKKGRERAGQRKGRTEEQNHAEKRLSESWHAVVPDCQTTAPLTRSSFVPSRPDLTAQTPRTDDRMTSSPPPL